MTLLKQKSDRLNKNGQPFLDFYLAWQYQGSIYLVRVNNSFNKDYSLLFATAREVPQGELLTKYVD